MNYTSTTSVYINIPMIKHKYVTNPLLGLSDQENNTWNYHINQKFVEHTLNSIGPQIYCIDPIPRATFLIILTNYFVQYCVLKLLVTEHNMADISSLAFAVIKSNSWVTYTTI